jgi:hypothetical protein
MRRCSNLDDFNESHSTFFKFKAETDEYKYIKMSIQFGKCILSIQTCPIVTFSSECQVS